MLMGKSVRTILLWMAILLAAVNAAAQDRTAPVYVTLWFDTEDYILPQDDDAAKRLAEMLTGLGVQATFKVVGEKARVLERRGRRDVIAAIKRHDVGYHSDTHSQPPTIAVYLQHAGWDDGRAEFYRRESPGARDVERIFGMKPSAYGNPAAPGRRRRIRRCATWASTCISTRPTTSASTTSPSSTAAC
jgi:hypothetical protein